MSLVTVIRNNRATIVCGVILAVVLGVLCAHTLAHGADAHSQYVALVHDADGETHELPLDEDGQLTVRTSLGTNTIEVRNGSVRMAEADCPNQTCVQARPLSAPGAQIICLPHQLWIEVVPAGSDGGEMDVSQAEAYDGNVDLQAR